MSQAFLFERINDGRKTGRVRINLSGIYKDEYALAVYFQKLVSRVCSRYLRKRIQEQIDNNGHHWLIEIFRERALSIFDSKTGSNYLFDVNDLSYLAKDLKMATCYSFSYCVYIELIGRKILISTEGDGFFEVSFHERINLDYLDNVLQGVLMEVLENEMK